MMIIICEEIETIKNQISLSGISSSTKSLKVGLRGSRCNGKYLVDILIILLIKKKITLSIIYSKRYVFYLPHPTINLIEN